MMRCYFLANLWLLGEVAFVAARWLSGPWRTGDVELASSFCTSRNSFNEHKINFPSLWKKRAVRNQPDYEYLNSFVSSLETVLQQVLRRKNSRCCVFQKYVECGIYPKKKKKKENALAPKYFPMGVVTDGAIGQLMALAVGEKLLVSASGVDKYSLPLSVPWRCL